MALVFNNVTVPQSGNVIYNGTSLSVVKHGNTQVWKRAPEYLYNNGDQCSGFTGGWDARAAYFLNTDTYYRNQTGTKPVFNTGNISVTCTGSYLGGGSVITNWPVDLSAVSSLTASINKFDPNGGKLTEGVCYPVQAEVGSSGGYSWVRIFVAGVQRYAAVLADRCQLVTLSPGDAFAACVAQGGDAAGQRAQRDGRQAGAYAQRTEASGTAPGV